MNAEYHQRLRLDDYVPLTSISENASDEGCKPTTITPRCSFTCKINTERFTNVTCKTWRNAIDPSDENNKAMFFLNLRVDH